MSKEVGLALSSMICPGENELVEYAEKYTSEYFYPLLKAQLLFLSRLEDNPTAWLETLRYLEKKWHVPDEDIVVTQAQIRKYAPSRE